MGHTNRPQTLLRTTSLLPGESLLSILFRLEKLNCYDDFSFFYNISEEERGDTTPKSFGVFHPSSTNFYLKLSKLTQISPKHLYLATNHRFSSLMNPLYVQQKAIVLPGSKPLSCVTRGLATNFHSEYFSAWCPYCLAEAKYYRLIWGVKSVSVCLKHQCLLNIRCPICKREIGVSEVLQAVCPRCQSDLRTVPAQFIDSSDRHGRLSQELIQAYLLGSFPPDDYIGLPRQPPHILYQVLDGLRSSLVSIRRDWPFFHNTSILVSPLPYKSQTYYRGPEDAYILYATACKSIINWPYSFYEFLDAYCKRNDLDTTTSLLTSMGSFYSKWIKGNWQQSDFHFIQETFNEYIFNYYRNTPSVVRSSWYRENEAFNKNVPYITIAEAARLLGVGSDIIKRLVCTEKLNPVPNDSARNYRANFVHRDDVIKLQQRWQEAVTLEEAADMLGLSQEVTLDLVSIALLIAERGPNIDGNSQWWFLRSQIAACLKDINQHVEKLIDDSIGQALKSVDLATAARMLAVVGINAARVLQFIAKGRLRAYSIAAKGNGLKELQFRAKDILLCIETVRAEHNWLTKKQVTRYFEIKPSMLKRWINSGWLSPVISIGNIVYFDRQTLDTFKARYITTKEAADLLSLASLTIQTWARQGRLTPISGPEVDGCHNYRFDKEALLAWRHQRLTFGEAMKLLGVSKATLHRWVEQGKLIPLEDMGGMQRWFARSEVENLQGRV